MRRPHTTNIALVSVVLSLPFVAACSGDDDGKSSDPGTGGTTQSSTTSTSAGGTSGSGGGTGGSGGNSGGSASGGSAGDESTTGTETDAGTGGSSTTDGSSSETSSTTGGSSSTSTGPWEDVTNNLTAIASGGRDISALAGQPGSERLIVGVGERGLFATDDGGGSWFALGQGSGSAVIPNRPLGIIFDPEDSTLFWENGIYGEGVFFTMNDGDTFARVGDIRDNDLVSVDFSDPQRRTMLASGHEAKQRLYLSTNAGDSWTDIGAQLPADTGFSRLPLVLDSDTFLLGVCPGGPCGVYRSEDQGDSWTQVSTEAPGSQPLLASNGFIYWQLTGKSGIIVSQDDGETWSKAAGPVESLNASAFELPDGRIIALGETHLQISGDHGANWSAFGEPLPAPGQNCNIYGMTYSVVGKALYINRNDCSGQVENAVMYRAEFDYASD